MCYLLLKALRLAASAVLLLYCGYLIFPATLVTDSVEEILAASATSRDQHLVVLRGYVTFGPESNAIWCGDPRRPGSKKVAGVPVGWKSSLLGRLPPSTLDGEGVLSGRFSTRSAPNNPLIWYGELTDAQLVVPPLPFRLVVALVICLLLCLLWSDRVLKMNPRANQ